MMLPLYRTLTTMGRPLIRLYLAYRQAKGKEDKSRFAERLGKPSLARPEGRLIWAHAASVGEALSLLPLVEKLCHEKNDLNIMVTTGTVTSAHLMEERLPNKAFHQFVPVDCLAYVRPFLAHWRPDLVLWAESEFWPNMIIESHALNIPMVLVNGRISAKSFAGWQRQPKLIGRILASFELCLGQTGLDAERLKMLGAANAQYAGNLKFAAPPLPVDETELNDLKNLIGNRPRWLAASTHSGEEETIVHAHKALRSTFPNLLTIIVPRHPERGTAVKDMVERLGLKPAQRSQSQAVQADTDIYIADTLGELGLFYRLCDIVFMGKSLSEHKEQSGGQNPLEAARLNCAIVQGPHTSNFADITERLRALDAFRETGNQKNLIETIGQLLRDQTACSQLANNAAEVAQSEDGALERVCAAISPLLDDHRNLGSNDANP